MQAGIKELVASRNRGQYALKTNDNLDLDKYDPHIKEFCTFSQNLFAVQNIFTDKKKEMEAYNACDDNNKTFRKLSLKELSLM